MNDTPHPGPGGPADPKESRPEADSAEARAPRDTPPPAGSTQDAPPPNTPPRYAPPRYAPPASPPQQPAYPVPLAGMPGPGGLFDGAVHAGELGRPRYGANPAEAFLRFFKNYANFSGRASRSEFWWMVLIFWIAFIALAVLGAVAAGASAAASPHLSDAVVTIIGLGAMVLLFGTLVPWLALGWRRLHDANLPGPLYLLCLLPYLGGLVVLIFMLLPPSVYGRRFDPQRR